MSGGSMDYLCFKMEDAISYIDDKEIKDLMKDMADLMHDLEWARDGDYSYAEYEEALFKFKEKWFGDKRNERLNEYITETLDNMKWEIQKLLGE